MSGQSTVPVFSTVIEYAACPPAAMRSGPFTETTSAPIVRVEPHTAPVVNPVAGACLSRASVCGPYAPSSEILSVGLLRFHSRWNAFTSMPRISGDAR